MTEAEWLACTDPHLMLEFLGGSVSGRKLRLFACACCRRIATHFEDGRSLRVVEVSERFADGEANPEELGSAFEDAADVQEEVHLSGGGAVEQGAAEAVLGLRRELQWGQIFEGIAEAVGEEEAGKAWDRIWGAAGKHWSTQEREHREACEAGEQAEWAAQAAVLCDLFGHLPFRPVAISPAWQTPQVMALAQAAYDQRELPSGTLDTALLAILADALEEAGCDNADILAHCRQPGPHVRGCWLIDALLGKS
jgi:hypothetical protein